MVAFTTNREMGMESLSGTMENIIMESGKMEKKMAAECGAQKKVTLI